MASQPTQTVTGTQVAIGDYLRQRRLDLDVSMHTLAAQAGLSAGYISLYEAGKRNPRQKTVRRILIALAEIEAAKTVAA